MKRAAFFRAAAGVLTLLLCAALCLTVLGLYREGLAARQASGSAAAPIFTREAMWAGLLRLWPLGAAWLAGMLAAAVFGGKAPVRRPKIAPLPGPMSSPTETRPLRLFRAALFAAALTLIALGVLNGGLSDVLIKAVHICTECIGLG